MAIDRLDLLIRQSRDRSGNKGTGSDSQGVPQRSFVSYANDAQARLFNLFMLRSPNLFTKESFIDTVSGQASYALPSDLYLKSRLISVQHTPNGNAQLFYELQHRSPSQQVSIRGLPDMYFLRNGYMVLSPIPNTGYTSAIRLNYQYIIPNLDIRRAKITSVNTGTNTITLTDNSILTQETESDLNGWVDSVCIVDDAGTIQQSALGVVSYSSTANTLVVSTQLTALTATNNYLVFGSNSTTHSQLPDICARYLVEYMALRAEVSDTSTEAQSVNAVLASIESEILDSIDMLEEVPVAIAILDHQFLNYSEDTDY